MLNSNIRCIEIVGKRSDNAGMIELNSNIRCIEMPVLLMLCFILPVE